MSDGSIHGPFDRRLLLFAPLVLPWSVLVIGTQGDVELVFLWGFVDAPSLHGFGLYAYLVEYTTTLPARLRAWPLGAAFYLGALLSAGSGALLGREDPRVTAGLLLVSGANAVPFSLGMVRVTPESTAVPLGLAVAGFVAWYVYWPKITSE